MLMALTVSQPPACRIEVLQENTHLHIRISIYVFIWMLTNIEHVVDIEREQTFLRCTKTITFTRVSFEMHTFVRTHITLYKIQMYELNCGCFCVSFIHVCSLFRFYRMSLTLCMLTNSTAKATN